MAFRNSDSVYIFGFRFGALLCVLLLSACQSPSRYSIKQDTGPSQPVSVNHIPDAVPRVEPRTIAGNKSPYTVLGKTYRVIGAPENYKAEGFASWYGKKFHGHKTSNGEIYNMYGMTAAHKSLPIPSYVRVTNKNNGISAIVRINDRGPFHEGRVIDLTYTAAKKLGFVDQGTAPVIVEYIDPVKYNKTALPVDSATNTSVLQASVAGQPKAPQPKHSGGYEIPANTYLQVGAFSKRESAETLQHTLQSVTQYPVNIYASDTSRWFRVRIGPLKDNLDVILLRNKLADNQLPEAHVVYQ